MKLLHVVDTLDPERGGVSQAVRTMASEISNAGIYNEVLTLDAPSQKRLDVAYKINNMGPSRGPWSYSYKLTPWLLENLSRFDTIIIHGLWLYVGFAVKQALAKAKRGNSTQVLGRKSPSLFIMPHGMLDPYFQQSKKRKAKAIRNWVYWKLIEGHIVNNSDGLLFTCRQECTLAREPFKPYQPRKELVVGLGVTNPPLFNVQMKEIFRSICPKVPYGQYILFLGRIDDKKGVDLVIEGYRRLLNNYLVNSTSGSSEGCVIKQLRLHTPPKHFPHLVIAGPGMQTRYGDMLQQLVNDSPTLREHVCFTGMLKGDDKWATVYGCEAFILPSHQENFGIAVVEALACSKPVLISRQVNISSDIYDEGAAIVEEDTVEGTYNMLFRWMLTPEVERSEMKNQARKCYEKHFAVQGATDNLIKAIL